MRSLWLDEALAGEEAAPRLGGAERADVCIVGGGFTGLWTALCLKEQEPSLDVVLVEADVCGAGASGRNGGFVLSWWAKLPFFDWLGGNDTLLVGAGYSGNGVGPSFLGGKILAALALGIENEWAASRLVRRPAGLPPEPIRYLGGRVVRSAVARKERAEDAAHEPRRVDLMLASLAPAALVPLKSSESQSPTRGSRLPG